VTRWTKTALGWCMAAAAPFAPAGTVAESEPNNTLAAPQTINDPGAATTVITGGRSFNDFSDDFYRFFVSAPGLLRITSTSTDASADSVMGLFNSTGTLLASNDDAALGNTMSAISFNVLAAGFYTIGFTGFDPGLLACGTGISACYDTNNDFVFDTFVANGGAGGSTGWTYAITIAQPIPEPETVLLFGAGLALVPWMRRRAATRRQQQGVAA
jgi:hypothetical protein